MKKILFSGIFIMIFIGMVLSLPADTDILAWYFDETGTLNASDRWGNNNLTLNYTLGNYVDGWDGNAINLSGLGHDSGTQWILANATPNYYNYTFDKDNFTIAFWFKANSGSQSVFLQLKDADTGWQVQKLANGSVRFLSNNQEYGVFNENVTDYEWHRIHFVREGIGTNQMKTYLNGINLYNTTMNHNVSAVGEQFKIINPTVGTSNVHLDDLKIYRGYAMTSDEIYDEFSGNITFTAVNENGDKITETSLVYWTIQEVNASHTGNPYGTLTMVDLEVGKSYTVNATDLSNSRKSNSTTIQIVGNKLNYDLTLFSHSSTFTFYNNTATNSTTGTWCEEGNSTYYLGKCELFNGTSLELINANLTNDVMISIDFGRTNVTGQYTNWSQYYEFINDGENRSVNLEIINNPDTIVWFKTITEGGEPIEEVEVQVGVTNPTIFPSNFLLAGQRLTRDDGTNFFYLDDESRAELIITKEGYESDVLSFRPGDRPNALTKAGAWEIVMIPTGETNYTGNRLALPKRFYNRTQQINGSFWCNGCTTASFNTDYNSGNTTIKSILTTRFEVPTITLTPGTHFPISGTDNINVNVYVDDVLWRTATIEYFTPQTGIYTTDELDIQDTTLFKVGMLILLIVISAVAGMMFSSETAGTTIFLFGSILIGLISTSFFWMSGIAVLFFMLRIIQKIISE